jgi:hypothetical protein
MGSSPDHHRTPEHSSTTSGAQSQPQTTSRSLGSVSQARKPRDPRRRIGRTLLWTCCEMCDEGKVSALDLVGFLDRALERGSRRGLRDHDPAPDQGLNAYCVDERRLFRADIATPGSSARSAKPLAHSLGLSCRLRLDHPL